MSTYTVAAAAGKALAPVPTTVVVPNHLVWNGSTWVAAPESHPVMLPLTPGVVLSADVGAYVAAKYPTLVTVT